MSASYLSHATSMFVVDCCQFGPHGCLGWKWNSWIVPTWLAVHQIKSVFFLTLYDSINDMKHFQVISIAPEPWHNHFCCWLLPIWPYLDVLAENGAYGLCGLSWRYNGENLYFSWSYMIVAMIWNTYELSASHHSRATAYGLYWIVLRYVWVENGAYGLCRIVWQNNRAKLSFPWPYMIVLMIFKCFRNVCITSQPCHSHFWCWLLPTWPYLDDWAENGAYGRYQLGWQYNVAKLYFSWSYMIVKRI